MDEAVRQFVRQRAGDCCEYCRLRQEDAVLFRFHVEHVRPRQHGGSDSADNLALACPNCNWAKGSNLSAVDPDSDQVVLLYNPRTDTWDEHFMVSGVQIVGQTSTGRATVRLLRLNADERLEVRKQIERGGA